MAIVTLAMLAIASGRLTAWLLPAASLVIGLSFAGLTFLAHETMHGATLRNPLLRRVVGWLTFLPFTLSPRLWVAWHNGVHHGNANSPGLDPDAYPTLDEHRESRSVRFATDTFGVGRGRLLGLLGLLIGFSVQSAHMLAVSGKRGYLTPREHRLALLETSAGVLGWALLLALLGPWHFLFAYLIPLSIANVVVMAYIFTNHALSPLTSVNDPLLNSLTVTVPRFVNWLTLGFGFHVEHHLFPWMSARHAPSVRALVLAHWPERYQSMPFHRALLAVHRTPRVYDDAITLVDPANGRRVPTLNAELFARADVANQWQPSGKIPASKRPICTT